jgi:hypothetical protein
LPSTHKAITNGRIIEEFAKELGEDSQVYEFSGTSPFDPFFAARFRVGASTIVGGHEFFPSILFLGSELGGNGWIEPGFMVKDLETNLLFRFDDGNVYYRINYRDVDESFIGGIVKSVVTKAKTLCKNRVDLVEPSTTKELTKEEMHQVLKTMSDRKGVSKEFVKGVLAEVISDTTVKTQFDLASSLLVAAEGNLKFGALTTLQGIAAEMIGLQMESPVAEVTE